MRAKGLLVLCIAAAGLCAAEPGWRFRTTVSRGTPDREGVVRPVEVAVDFPALVEQAGEFDPASVRVMEHGGNRELPYAWRSEFDARKGRAQRYLAWFGRAPAYDLYFDTKDSRRAAPHYAAEDLPTENLATWEWQASPVALVRPGRPLQVVVDETTSAAGREVSLSQNIDVRRFAGQEMVFECDLTAERAAYGAPVTIELEQHRADGSRIQEYAVPPRWLTVELAQGQLVRFSERGRFSPDAATVVLRLRFRCEVKDADTGETVSGPESHFSIRLDRVVVRPGERWMWPEASHAGFVEGALATAPLNRAFLFTGQRRLVFNGASEGTMQAGAFHPDPNADHWGVQAGTLEFWCRPQWNAGEHVERILYDANSYGHRLHSRLRKLADGALEFTIADAGGTLRTVRGPAPLVKGRWHHLAATWDFPRAHLQLFVDGRRVGQEGPGNAPWPSSLVAVGGKKKTGGIGIEERDTRSIPMQAFIGGDQAWNRERGAEAAIDEFRISDTARYGGDFSPQPAEFAPDEHTRALFHFENERDGVHGGDDRFVRGYLACEAEPQRQDAPLESVRNGSVESRMVAVEPNAQREKFDANRAENVLPVTRPVRELPDPRFIEYRERKVLRVVTGKDDGFVLRAGGDFAPLPRAVVFRAGASTTIPHWRSGGAVLPFSVESLRKTLATGTRTDRDKALEVFRYALATTNYFDNEIFSEIMPNGRVRPSVAYAFLKALNIYPWSQCGPLNYTMRKLFLAMGLSSNDAPGTHHQYQQVFFDGSLRLFDLMPRVYWLERDNETAASLRGIREDPYLKLRQGGDVNMWLPGRVEEASFGAAERPHDMTFRLRAGETASLCWHNEGRWFELSRGPLSLARIPPYYGNGAILYEPVEGSEAAALDNLAVRGPALQPLDAARPASLTYRLFSPYILSDGRATGRFTGADW